MTALTTPLATPDLFYDPISLPSWTLLAMLLPLCLAVATIYKTVRVTTLRQLGWEILLLFLYMLTGLTTLMLIGYAIVAHL